MSRKSKSWLVRFLIFIGSCVAAAISVALSETFKQHLVSLFKFIWSSILSIWHHLGNTASVYWWIVYLVSIISLSLIGFFLYLCFQNSKKPDWEDTYKTDNFEGVSWQWDYYLEEIINPIPYCPKCQMQLIVNEGFGNIFYLQCEHCDLSTRINTTSFLDLQNKIKRLIARKITTGEWKQTIKVKS